MEVYSSKQTPLQVDASIASNLDSSKVCLCPTNFVFAGKEPCPQRGRELLQSRTYNKERQ